MDNGVAPMRLSHGISSILGLDDTNTPLNLCLKPVDEKRCEKTLHNIITNVSQRVQEIDVNLLSVSANSNGRRCESASTDSGSLDERRNGEEIVNLSISYGLSIESWKRETNKDKVLLSGKGNAEKSKIDIEDDENERPGFNDDVNEQENETLRNNGTDVDEEKAENEHAENCNGDNLTDTGGRVNNRKHLSSTRVDNENCDSTTTSEKSLGKHKRILNVQGPHICDICDKQYVYKNSLVLHLRTHNEEKLYTCDECNKSFTQKCILSRHMRIHSGEKPFTCTECKKSFSQKNTLSRHMMIHRGEKPHRCSVCNKPFRQKTHLSLHMRIHRDEKPYSCLECKKSFRQKSYLSVHMRINNGVRCTYTCYYCGTNYVKKKDLKDHCVQCYKSQSVGKLIKSHD